MRLSEEEIRNLTDEIASIGAILKRFKIDRRDEASSCLGDNLLWAHTVRRNMIKITEKVQDALLSKLANMTDEETKEEIKATLVKTFAQTVEYGAMCSECCSNLGDIKGKAGCEMSENPLNPDDYCPQQMLAIGSVANQISALLTAKVEQARKEGIMEVIKWINNNLALSPFEGKRLQDKCEIEWGIE